MLCIIKRYRRRRREQADADADVDIGIQDNNRDEPIAMNRL